VAKSLNEHVKATSAAVPADEQELHMLGACSHINEFTATHGAVRVQVVPTVEQNDQDVNGGVVNNVRIK
jgi:hypothetical protein